MKYLKILSLSVVFLSANCSYIGDKMSGKNEPDVQISQKQEEEQNIVSERVYIKDDAEISGDYLRGDEQQDLEYPNLAEVPNRPQEPISIEEQKQIIKDLEEGKVANLEPVQSDPVEENIIKPEKFNQLQEPSLKEKKYNRPNNNDMNQSIRDILDQRLEEIDTYKPKMAMNQQSEMDEMEKELHELTKQLKEVKTEEQVIDIEKRIQKNDLFYSPNEIEKILGFKGLDKSNLETKKVYKKKPIETQKKETVTEVVKKDETDFFIREAPIAKISFPHGSTNIKNTDIEKIKSIVSLFYENGGKKVVIVGHASSRTNYDMDLTKHALTNFNISLERATSVMQQFSTLGLKSEKMEIVAMSDAKPLYPEIMPRLEAANRRAEIFIQY